MKRRFIYPEDQFDEDLCKCHVLFIAGKALHNLRSNHNRHYVQEGKTPYKDYNFITRQVWEEFVEKMSTDEAKAKGQEYSELAKKDVLPHHLGMTGYAAKRKKLRQEEMEADAAGLENPFKEVNERGCDYFYARRPKKLKKGMAKYNEPKAEEAEKALIAISASKQQGKFEPVGQHDLLTEALGNPEHRGRVQGISSRHSWKKLDS